MSVETTCTLESFIKYKDYENYIQTVIYLYLKKL